MLAVCIWQVDSGYVCEADHKTMAKAIKDRVAQICRKREQRQQVREEQEKRKQEEECMEPQRDTQTAPAVQPEAEEPEADQHQLQNNALPHTSMWPHMKMLSCQRHHRAY